MLSRSSYEEQPAKEISTVIWLAQYDSLELNSAKQKDEFLTNIAQDIREDLLTIKTSSSGKQIHLSYSDFIDAVDNPESMNNFPEYNYFIVLSLPTEDTKTATTISKKQKKLTWIIKPSFLEEYQIQSCLVLNQKLNLQQPIASLLGKTYHPLAALLASPVPNLEKIMKEIRSLYQKEKLPYGKKTAYGLFASKKYWENSLFDFVFSENTPISLKEKLIKQAVVNLLIASPAVCTQFEKILSKKLKQKDLSILPSEASGIIQEYVQPNVFRF